MPSGSLGNTTLSKKPVVVNRFSESAPSPLNSEPPNIEAIGSNQIVILIFDDYWSAWRDDSATNNWVYMNSIAVFDT